MVTPHARAAVEAVITDAVDKAVKGMVVARARAMVKASDARAAEAVINNRAATARAKAATGVMAIRATASDAIIQDRETFPDRWRR